ncbi:PUTATIVE TWO-COMPONENT SENSOR [hydrothermal vent metagenome]|uniref:PUTATIVE TWO-COMPONENT SENSOR n=1 Tax=hydrothermal vent metagenome TaxID=652676 RepID=A0A1W1D587_9ZZZZ
MHRKEDLILTTLQDCIDNDKTLSKSDIEIILTEYKKQLSRSEKILKQNDKQQFLMLKLNEELDEYKNNLEKKVVKEVAKRREKEKILLQQSKLASVGEMIDAIAHQWKQPLNVMSGQVAHLMLQFQFGMLNEENLKKFEKNIIAQIEHMTNTLDEFRSFFRPSKNVENFYVKEMIDKVLLLTKDEFAKNNIEIILNCEDNVQLYGVENEFKHLVINILNNAKDAFIERNIKDRKIHINCFIDKKYKILEIVDNAGGIPKNVINDIFKANITTKKEGKGTGIGLYMSAQIAQKHHGVLSVENTKDGAKFIFKTEFSHLIEEKK